MKLIVCDIDGTIVDAPTQKLPSKRLISAIKLVKDEYLVTCATGRSRSWAKEILASAHLTAPCIVGGGTYVMHSETYDILMEKPLLPSSIRDKRETLKDYLDERVLVNDYKEEDYLNGGWEMQALH